jgi:hypothetical protein
LGGGEFLERQNRRKSTLRRKWIALTISLVMASVVIITSLSPFVIFDAKAADLNEGPLDWSVSTLDSAGNMGFAPSMAIDSNGVVHVAYMAMRPATPTIAESSYLKYATKSNGTWRFETIDNTMQVGGVATLVVDGTNTVNIIYQDYDNGTLRYARGSFGNWQITILHGLDGFPEDNSMVIDHTGVVHICCRTYPNGNISYITNFGGVWSHRNVFIGGDAYEPSLSLDANGNPHIVFYDYNSDTLFHASENDGVWEVHPLFPGEYSQFFFEPGGAMDIIYSTSYPGELTLCREEKGVWSNQSIGVSGWGRLALDPDGSFSVACLSGFPGSLRYASNIGKVWSNQVLEQSATVRTLPTLAVDSKGECHICYYDGVKADLMYAHVFTRKNGTPCQVRADVSERGVILSWSPPHGEDSAIITGYNIYRGETSGQEKLLATVGNVLTYTDADLTSSHTYYYRMSALNSTGEGSLTKEFVATTNASSPDNQDSILLYIGIGAIAIIAVAGVAIVVMRRRK